MSTFSPLPSSPGTETPQIFSFNIVNLILQRRKNFYSYLQTIVLTEGPKSLLDNPEANTHSLKYF